MIEEPTTKEGNATPNLEDLGIFYSGDSKTSPMGERGLCDCDPEDNDADGIGDDGMDD